MQWIGEVKYSSWESLDVSLRWKEHRVTTTRKSSMEAISNSQCICCNVISEKVRNYFKPVHSESESDLENTMDK